MSDIPPGIPHHGPHNWLEQLQVIGMAGIIILLLGGVLFICFIVQLASKRRNYGGILAYITASFLPILAGVTGATRAGVRAFETMGTAGISDPGALSQKIGELLMSFWFGSVISFLALVGGCILAMLGPSRTVTPPQIPG